MSDEPETIIYDADEYDADGSDQANEAPNESTDDMDGAHLALTPIAPPSTPAYQGPSRAEIEALKGTLKAANRDMTDAQFIVFLAAAKHLGLDPLARQIVPIFQGGRMTVQTTIDGFRLIAERTRKYRGQIGPQWCGKDAVWQDVWLADEPPLAARVGVKRSDFDEPMWGVARYKSYHKDTPTWKAMPDVMLAKVAESLALRKTFPAELSGAYTAEELMVVDADPLPPASSHPSPPTPARTQAATKKSAPSQAAPKAAQAASDLPTWGKLASEAKALGVSESDWQTSITHLTGKARKTDPTTGEVITISAQLTDDDKRTMMAWLEKRHQQFTDADTRTPPLESLAYANAN